MRMPEAESLPRLPLADRLLYAVASLGNSALFYGMTLWLVYFYAPPPESGLPGLVPVLIVGLALGFGRVIETFDDPLIGWWSDRTRSRWGRRVPFLLIGAPLLALTFTLLWTPPLGEESFINAVYFFIVLEAFFLVNTIVSAPYEAIMVEIAFTSRDRVNISALKVAFGSAGAAVAMTLSPLLVSSIGFKGMGVVLALLAFAALYITLFGLWLRGRLGYAPATVEQPPSLVESVRISLGHRSFLAFAGSYTLFYLGFSMLTQLIPYYVQATLGLSEDRVAWYTGAVIGAVLLSLPLLTAAAARWGKRRMYGLAMLVLAVWLPALGLTAFEPLLAGVPLWLQSLAVIGLAGVPFAAVFVFPGALMADIIDDDARRTGTERAALYFGMQSTLQKMAFAGAAGLFGLLLQGFGYTGAQALGIRLVGPLAGLCVALGFVVFAWGYNLPDPPDGAPLPALGPEPAALKGEAGP